MGPEGEILYEELQRERREKSNMVAKEAAMAFLMLEDVQFANEERAVIIRGEAGKSIELSWVKAFQGRYHNSHRC